MLTMILSMVLVAYVAYAATVTIRPDGAGANSGWTNNGCSAGSSEWQCVDEDPASTSDYLSATGTAKETVTFSDTGLTTQSVNSVTLFYYAMQHNSANNACFEAVVRSGSTDYLAGTQMCASSSWSYLNHAYSTNPATGSAWTISEVDALQAGMKGLNPNGGGRVAQVYAVVDYVPLACADDLDNDNDGLTDLDDAGCSSAEDDTETNASLICDDGTDASNDRDTLADFRLSGGDPGCTSATDDSEVDGMCDDSVDDASDSDSLADGSDAGCSSTSDQTEANGACDELADNDNDGLVDFPNDPGCTSYSDSSELGTAQCDNGVDASNDADSLADFRLSGGDPGCASATDSSEIDGQCDDLTDNDGDGTRDFTSANFTVDPECASYADIEYDCSDSDGGNFPLVQGTASGSFGGIPFSNPDICADSTTLTEYYCSPFTAISANINCVNATQGTTSCSSGVCI